MFQANATFHSVYGKRRVLVVDDEYVNREILGSILSDDYEVLYANDGIEAMECVEEYIDTLSLVLLDLIMPHMSGQEVLKRMKESPEMREIPVVVVSGDVAQEIDCLKAGASDFIQKPYPDPGVIRARVLRTIELSEDRQIIRSTERDQRTGLYNREYFYSYAHQYDQHHKGSDMDAIVVYINHFNLVSEKYGREFADSLVRDIGESIRSMVHDDDGIVTRDAADVYLVYCPHRDDYKAILDNAAESISDDSDNGRRIRLHMGVYSSVDKELSIERRFDRAKMAADTVRDSYTRRIGIYDDTLHKAELYSQRLIDDFPQAMEQRQFVVYYQPKYDIQTDSPTLSSAEALVRWNHPQLGIINPGVFIPLFEENGLIQTLDRYVWNEAARQIREWKETLNRFVPVSVNVSRVDMYDSSVIDTLLKILDDNGIAPGELHLELTESAYAEDSEQIIQTVKRLRSLGFVIEMDDFGTGYSSLNMLTSLPIDTLKLDMAFIRTSFSKDGDNDTHMLKVIIGIAEHLSVPVVAEGVETEEQLNELKGLGCDAVQGYYFSEPVPAGEYEQILVEGKAPEAGNLSKLASQTLAEPAPGEREEEAPRAKWWEKVPSIPLRRASFVFVAAALVAAFALFVADAMVSQGYHDMQASSDRYIEAQRAATNLEAGSDSLTESVRSFVATGDIDYLYDYFEELEVTRRRDIAVETLEELLEGNDSAAYQNLSTALQYSNELVSYEYQAMKLMLESGDYGDARIPVQLQEWQLEPDEEALSPQQKREKARTLVFGEVYATYKGNIKGYTAECTQELISTASQERLAASNLMSLSVALQTVLTIVFLLVVIVIVIFISGWVRQPLTRMVDLMREERMVPPLGAEELRYVSRTYNTVFEESRRKYELLNYGSMHDALTGLFNRKAYDIMRKDLDLSNTALLLIDVDKFKTVNDTYGHDVGDLILKRVAEVLGYSFRSTDLVFRLGGDEFVIIMTHVDSSMRKQVKDKIDQTNLMLQKPSDDLPPTSLSVGVAFADRENPEGDIFKDADTALYRVKEAGRCGCYIY